MNRKVKTIMLSFAIIGMGFLTTAAISEDSINQTNVESTSTAIMEFKTTELSLGTIPQGIPIDIAFEFVNNGASALIITNAKPSCGCTNVKFPETPITTGESAQITAVYNAKSAGSFTKTITVFSNASGTPQQLKFTGIVE
jgi:hypothetical protein